MQSELSPLTRLDALLWFLRVQMWLLGISIVLGVASPNAGKLGVQSLQIVGTSGVSVFVLAVFPRALALAALGSSAHKTLEISDLSVLVRRCVGLALLVTSLGHALLLAVGCAEAFIAWRDFSMVAAYLSLPFLFSFVSTSLSFFLGFALAFGFTIRANFRAR